MYYLNTIYFTATLKNQICNCCGESSIWLHLTSLHLLILKTLDGSKMFLFIRLFFFFILFSLYRKTFRKVYNKMPALVGVGEVEIVGKQLRRFSLLGTKDPSKIEFYMNSRITTCIGCLYIKQYFLVCIFESEITSFFLRFSLIL